MLEIRDLQTSYGRSQVLFGVNLDIGQNEVVSLLGRNGMGKTTTVRSIMGITPARGGTISFRGAPIRGRPGRFSISSPAFANVPRIWETNCPAASSRCYR